MKIGEADACPLRRGRLELRNHMWANAATQVLIVRRSLGGAAAAPPRRLYGSSSHACAGQHFGRRAPRGAQS
eukprot:scaffold2732_cov124-Pinguiococcus_pyrenoidosus.AAC.2